MGESNLFTQVLDTMLLDFFFFYLITFFSKCQKNRINKILELFKIILVQIYRQSANIGITHVFSCINICRVPRMLFEHEADRPSVQHHPRDPASVNAMKQTCVIVILAYFTLFQPNSH